MSLSDSPHVDHNVHIHAEVMIRLGADIGLPAPIMVEFSLAGLDGAMNLDEFETPLEMLADAKAQAKRWRKEIIEQYPGEFLSNIIIEMTGFIQMARLIAAQETAKEDA